MKRKSRAVGSERTPPGVNSFATLIARQKARTAAEVARARESARRNKPPGKVSWADILAKHRVAMEEYVLSKRKPLADEFPWSDNK